MPKNGKTKIYNLRKETPSPDLLKSMYDSLVRMFYGGFGKSKEKEKSALSGREMG